jgi:hypothetical protein
VLKTEIFKNIGNFESNNVFFEREFADKYFKVGNYITCFLNRVSCRHIGKLLCQRNDPKFKNAYELNGINQFNQVKKTVNVKNFTFYPNKDSVDFDIIYIPNKSIDELIEIANTLPNCVGFNSLGYLKYKLVDENKYIFLPNIKNNPEGLFIKNTS